VYRLRAGEAKECSFKRPSMMTVRDWIDAFLLSNLSAVLFYWAVGKAYGGGNNTLRYLGFGVLMGFSAFTIIVLLSTRFYLNPLFQFIITVGCCAVFLNSRLLERILSAER
jgi:hypothetical protein